MKRTTTLLATFIFIATATADVAPTEKSTTETKSLSAAARRFLNHVDYLASDELKGRGFATPDIDAAADYIAKQWQAAGVEPAGDDDTFFQAFEITARKQLDRDDAALALPGINRELKLGTDWTPLPFSAIGDADGPLAFAGYGIEAPEHDYDDYLDIDATDKIVIIFRYEPRDKNPDAAFGGSESSEYAFFREKAATAAKHGAKGIIVINPPNHPNTVDDQLIAFDPWATRPTYDLPMVQITRDVARDLFKTIGLPNVDSLQKRLDEERLSLSEEFPNHKALIKTGVRPARGKNVVGVLRGNGSTDETIVVGAHYDHLGARPSRGSDEIVIHNGADDNASGTAALIELAERLAAEKDRRRNVLFIAFSAEELGLWGSRHYVKEPTQPLESLKAMINFDMIGRYRDGEFEITGTKSAEGLKELVEKSLAQADIAADLPTRFRPDSDHAPFHRAGIPHLFFHTGLHSDYHRPGDDTDLINSEGAIGVIDVGHSILSELVNMTEGPTPLTESESDSNSDSPRASAPRRARVRLGILPNLEDDGPGMLITRVVEGGSASKAGIQDNDRILKIGDTDVASLTDYRKAMQDYNYGDAADIIVQRDGEEVTLKTEFVRPRRSRSAPQ